MCTFLSLSREKYQKSATQGRPPGASLTEPTTCVRATPSPSEWRRGLIARKVGDTRWPARTAERRPRSARPRRGEGRGNPSYNPANRGNPASSALRRGCGHPVIREVTAHKALLPPGKRARRTGDRILKESTWVLSLRGDSFGTFLSPRKEKYVVPSPRQTQIYFPHTKTPPLCSERRGLLFSE